MTEKQKTLSARLDDMERELVEVNARLNAHAHVIEYLIHAAQEAGHLDPADLISHLLRTANYGSDTDDDPGDEPGDGINETPNQAWLRALASAYHELFVLNRFGL